MFDKIRKAFGGSEKPKAETKQKIESAPEVEETAAPVAETKQETATNKPRIGYIHLSGCTGDGCCTYRDGGYCIWSNFS